MAFGCDCESVYGFGFRISLNEFERIDGRPRHISERVSDFNESLKIKGCRELPDGFDWSFYGATRVGCIISTTQDLSKILRGEIKCPDFNPLLEWAKKHGIKFENEQ